jgi:hypothetical protein
VTSEELAAIRARVEIADRDDSYLRSYTGASNADLYRHPQVRADMRALLNEVARLTAEVGRLSAVVVVPSGFAVVVVSVTGRLLVSERNGGGSWPLQGCGRSPAGRSAAVRRSASRRRATSGAT